ncbi:conserved hypothetical protein [Candida dubliniensis CD36]|uniref:Ribosomal RNA-processing protein n=1 Tax=Candida dubliniensis (strain CD36 / ATCC MYA-646 / CBS 7987 / NCPF 3949 / NRRL Y-17841) TaxID=573826 RepID=B9W8H7_CANDC|nr:conserved hypothetical protein [Candida dubliniensis CD36]CAX45048.1 conserved hypothetical protein [Candida dubliniensis CD36]
MAGIKKNREILTGGKKYIQQKQKKHLVDEVVFDKESRQEYLTGFHKRKVQRQKKAQEFHKEQERLAKIEERKQLKQERERDLQNQLQQFNKTAQEIAAINNDIGFDQSDDNSNDNEEWSGFQEDEHEEVDEGKNTENPLKGILHHTEIYKQDPSLSNITNGAIIDDETTVVVESLDNPNTVDTEEKLKQLAKLNNVNLAKSDQVLEKSIERAKNYAVICGVAKPNLIKQKKKKFRYLTKSERRENVRKEKSKSKAKAKR